MAKDIIEFKIELEGIKPKIWRIFQVESSITFNELHKIIQKVMGWEDYHMYDFKAENTNIIDSRSESFEQVLGRDIAKNEIKANKAKLFDFIKNKGQKVTYMYDMGDSWEHKLTVKNIFEVDDSKKDFPVVIDGERACPPEDSGGIWGYENLLEIQKDPENPEYEEMIEDWLGEDFDPEYFDVDEVNKKFRRKKYKVK